MSGALDRRGFLFAVIAAAGLSVGIAVLESDSTPGPQPRVARSLTPSEPMMHSRLIFSEPGGMDVVSGTDARGQRCLEIGGTTTYCFTADEMQSGQAMNQLTRCPPRGVGRRVIAGIAPLPATRATLTFDTGNASGSRVVDGVYAFAIPMPRGAFPHPSTIAWSSAGVRRRTVRYPVTAAEDTGCNRP